jgi:hypothetical protein
MSTNTVHAGLRLVDAPPEPPPLPELPQLFDDSVRRPGELHEPVALNGQLRGLLNAAARQMRLPTGLTGRLLIEVALVIADLARLGLDLGTGLDRLDDAATGAVVRRRLSAAEADYLRHLRHPDGVSETLLSVPVRLAGRLHEVDLGVALRGDPVRAVTWEVGALLAGRTMLEWALVALAGGVPVSSRGAGARRGDPGRPAAL